MGVQKPQRTTNGNKEHGYKTKHSLGKLNWTNVETMYRTNEFQLVLQVTHDYFEEVEEEEQVIRVNTLEMAANLAVLDYQNGTIVHESSREMIFRMLGMYLSRFVMGIYFPMGIC